jgi:uncharacterized protein YkwD
LSPVQPSLDPAEQQFIALVNQARQTLSLQPLAANGALNVAADSHSYWQDAVYGYGGLSHDGCNGSQFWQRLGDAGYAGLTTGEVTLVRYPPASAQTAFDMFRNSPGHWALLTSPDFTEIGVGEAGYHWTGDLGRR